MTGIGFALTITLGAVVWWLWERTDRKDRTCRHGLEDTRSASSHSPSATTAAPATYAASMAQQQPTTSCPDPREAATHSRTYAQPIAAATTSEATAPSNGGAADTPRTSSTPNNRSSNGVFLANRTQDTSRQPVCFFSSKKNPARS